ncbi:MAG TPA: hypothetical protein VJ992_12765 [Gemmatimonadales bacterium]|nr:hypothetical protein [Gemmatimonadales bacterium]
MSTRAFRDRRLLVELFVSANLAFLVVDVAIAHAVNAFRNAFEWIPVGFAGAGAVLLVPGIVGAWRRDRPLGRLGTVVGWCGVAVGIAGLIFHLRSQFFASTTLHSLVYSAPFVAPLAFTGLGLLLLANRMVPDGTREWAQWVVFLALGGFGGNFVLSLTDHAQNGFFNALEWVPVFASAIAVGFLLVALFRPLTRGFARACWLVLALQVVTGVAGFALHVWFDVHGPARRLELDFLYGAPAFAPLLFADLAVLAAIGLTGLRALPEV